MDSEDSRNLLTESCRAVVQNPTAGCQLAVHAAESITSSLRAQSSPTNTPEEFLANFLCALNGYVSLCFRSALSGKFPGLEVALLDLMADSVIGAGQCSQPSETLSALSESVRDCFVGAELDRLAGNVLGNDGKLPLGSLSLVVALKLKLHFDVHFMGITGKSHLAFLKAMAPFVRLEAAASICTNQEKGGGSSESNQPLPAGSKRAVKSSALAHVVALLQEISQKETVIEPSLLDEILHFIFEQGPAIWTLPVATSALQLSIQVTTTYCSSLPQSAPLPPPGTPLLDNLQTRNQVSKLRYQLQAADDLNTGLRSRVRRAHTIGRSLWLYSSKETVSKAMAAIVGFLRTPMASPLGQSADRCCQLHTSVCNSLFYLFSHWSRGCDCCPASDTVGVFFDLCQKLLLGGIETLQWIGRQVDQWEASKGPIGCPNCNYERPLESAVAFLKMGQSLKSLLLSHWVFSISNSGVLETIALYDLHLDFVVAKIDQAKETPWGRNDLRTLRKERGNDLLGKNIDFRGLVDGDCGGDQEISIPNGGVGSIIINEKVKKSRSIESIKKEDKEVGKKVKKATPISGNPFIDAILEVDKCCGDQKDLDELADFVVCKRGRNYKDVLRRKKIVKCME